jgi:hypothetical protein
MTIDSSKDLFCFISGQRLPIRLALHTLNWMSLTVIAVSLVTTLFAPVAVRASEPEETLERLGHLGISDFLIEPQYVFSEAKRGGFSAGSSFVAFSWDQKEPLSAHLKMGSRRLIGVPSRYAATDPTERMDDAAVIEAYAQSESLFGRLRAGMIPIYFGLEGGNVEHELRFPRSAAFRNGWVNLRDVGISFQIRHEGFFSDWAIHNGEGGSDLDNEAWFTARWGWRNRRSLRLGLSGSTGRTAQASTSVSDSSSGPSSGLSFGGDEGGLDSSRPAKIRLANLFVQWESRPIRAAIELTAGDLRQGESELKARTGRFDFEYGVHHPLGFLFRFESFDPQTDREGDRREDVTLGMILKNRYETSTLFLLATRSVGETQKEGEYRCLLAWRMTPSANRLFSPL